MRQPRLLPLLLLIPVLPACGTDVSSPSGALLSCLFSDPRLMTEGAVVQVDGAGNEALCVDGPGSDESAFVYIPFHAAEAAEGEEPLTLDVSVVGAAFTPPDGEDAAGVGYDARLAPQPGAGRGHGFEAWLRQKEIRELEPRLRGGRVAGDAGDAGEPERAAGNVAADVPAVGDLLELNVAISCTGTDLRTGRVTYVSDRAIVVEDIANPSVLEEVAFYGETFDTLVYPVATAHFGEPSDIDQNQRSILFFTRAVNERNSGAADFFTIGFFWSGDLFPETDTARLDACPRGNDAEMFYLIAPDQHGDAGPAVTPADVRRVSIPLLGHELQHLINASRRMFVNEASTFEAPWLNEGLSHAAEELLFYEVAGLQPGSNLTTSQVLSTEAQAGRFDIYMRGNVSNLLRYLSSPDSPSLMGADGLVTRGAAWAFLRYAADRSGRGDAEFFFDVVNSRVAGLENLAEVLGGGDRPLGWMRDWTVAIYADDLPLNMAEPYRFPSWSLRDLYVSIIGAYPLRPVPLDAGTATRVELQAGGAAYTELRVEPGDRAVIHAEVDGKVPPASLRGSLVRVR